MNPSPSLFTLCTPQTKKKKKKLKDVMKTPTSILLPSTIFGYL